MERRIEGTDGFGFDHALLILRRGLLGFGIVEFAAVAAGGHHVGRERQVPALQHFPRKAAVDDGERHALDCVERFLDDLLTLVLQSTFVQTIDVGSSQAETLADAKQHLLGFLVGWLSWPSFTALRSVANRSRAAPFFGTGFRWAGRFFFLIRLQIFHRAADDSQRQRLRDILQKLGTADLPDHVFLGNGTNLQRFFREHIDDVMEIAFIESGEPHRHDEFIDAEAEAHGLHVAVKGGAGGHLR